jgi:dienelactone hydrolase
VTRWGKATEAGGVTERPFRLGAVPGILWSPAGVTARRPLILIGHGGSGHKRNARTVALATWFAREAGLPAVAIDGPHHGDRRTLPDYFTRARTEGMPAILDQMATDWLATVDALTAEADTGNLAYIGMSMGARFGLPTATALGPRLRAAVLGKFGLTAVPAQLKAVNTPARTTSDARHLTAPTLFHLQHDDEIFPRQGQLALFKEFTSHDKHLITYPGRHASTPPQAIARWRTFVLHHLQA